MSVAPHAGVIDFGTFTPPTPSLDGIQGEVPQPLIGQDNYVLTGNGWSSLGALGALTYQGTWDASTNTPTLVSSVGVQGYYYVVSVAGNTDLNGTTTWDVGDWAIFNGSAWQKIEGGTVGTFTNVITPQVTARTNNLTLSAISTGTVTINTAAANNTFLLVKDDLTASPSTTGLTVLGASSGLGRLALRSNKALYVASGSSNNISFLTNSGVTSEGSTQMLVSHTASAVNYVQVTGATTSNRPRVSFEGSDGNIGGLYLAKGSGGHSFCSDSNASVVQFSISRTASAVNNLQATGSATGLAPSFSAIGTDTNIDLAINSKGTGSIVFNTGNGIAFKIYDGSGGTAQVNYWQARGRGASAAPFLITAGTDTNISGNISSAGTGSIVLMTNGGSQTQFQASHTASAVNYIQSTGGTTGNRPAISAQGSDTNIGLQFTSKNTGTIRFDTRGGSGIGLLIGDSGSAVNVNYVQITGNATTLVPSIASNGTDTNISMAFQPKGTGAIDLAAGSSGVNISNGNTVTAITRVAGGNSYTSALTATVSAPTTAGGTTATATAYAGSITVAVAGGGTGYTLNDVITVVGGTRTQAQAYTVTGVSAGVITAVTVQTFGFYTVLPTNPVSVTGGTGTGATLNLSNWSFTNITLDTAGSGYIEQPTVTIAGSGGSGATAFATIGSNTSIKTHGNYASFFASNSGSESLRLYGNDSGGGQSQQATGPGLVIVPAQSGYGATRIGTQQSFHSLELGSATNTGGNLGISFNTAVTYAPSSGGIGSGNRQMAITHTASAVNYVQVTGSATTARPAISTQGSDSNIGLDINAKGTSDVTLRSGTSATFQAIMNTGGDSWLAANRMTGLANLTATSVSASNVAISLQTKGTGAIDLAAGSGGINISNGGTVSAITRTSSGGSYTSIPSIAISAPTTAGGVQATASAALFIQSVTIQSGGTGYTVNDVLTVVGGTSSAAATLRVDTVSSGVITSVSVLTGGTSYTALPTNPFSVTGGTGSSATFNATAWGVSSGITVTAAGSGYIEQPTITFSGGGGSGAAAYATVGSTSKITHLATTNDIYGPGGIAFRTSTVHTASTQNYWSAVGNNNAPSLIAQTTTGASIATTNASAIQFLTSSTLEQFRVSHTASAVNYVQVTGSATGSHPVISGQGSDANVNVNLTPKGTGTVLITRLGLVSSPSLTIGQANNGLYGLGTGEIGVVGSGWEQFRFGNTGSAVNYLRVNGNVAGSAPILSAQGTDTNIDLELTPKGTGNVRYGTHTATADVAISGYIEIKDSSGTIRKLAVIS